MSGVRKANMVDLERLRSRAKFFHKLSCMRHKPIKDEHIDAYFKHMDDDPNAFVLVHGNAAVGATVDKAEMGFGFILRERFLISSRKKLGPLLDAFHRLAVQKKVDLTSLSLMCKDNKIPKEQHERYIDMGYELAEAVYVRKVG